VFCLTYNYTAFPMVRQARAMVRDGDIGDVRMVQVEYVQGHNAALSAGERGAAAKPWRLQPEKAGASLILGDIGSHAHHMACFVAGQPFARLCADVPSVQAVKLEEAPTLPKITRLRALVGERVGIFGGLGGVYFFEELSRGADGAMTGFPYPEALRAIHDHFVADRRDEARALFYRWLPLIRYETQPGSIPGTSIAIRKEILRRRRWIGSAFVRPPATALDASTLDELTEILAAVAT